LAAPFVRFRLGIIVKLDADLCVRTFNQPPVFVVTTYIRRRLSNRRKPSNTLPQLKRHFLHQPQIPLARQRLV